MRASDNLQKAENAKEAFLNAAAAGTEPVLPNLVLPLPLLQHAAATALLQLPPALRGGWLTSTSGQLAPRRSVNQ